MAPSSIPRPEYPRPQCARQEWLNLNGEWRFEMDPGDSGLERGLLARPLAGKILVPFCPESLLSGIGHTDFLNAVWYRREVAVPAGWAGKRLLLHFQAVDYDATVWVNGVEAGRHRGGFTPFSCDITGLAEAGRQAVIVLRARDNTRNRQPSGKQSDLYANHGCSYTRTTGIWQTVWLEPVPQTYLLRPRVTPDVGQSCFHVEQRLAHPHRGLALRATLTDAKGVVAQETVPANRDFSVRVTLNVPQERRQLWGPGSPHLYGLQLELLDASGVVLDTVDSYCGLRSVAIDGLRVLLNGQSVFQRLVLDQGFYPGGIWTAPTDAALRNDIVLSLEAGFNGARLHQKVFEERFLYHADQLGYLVWGEFGDWGCREPKHEDSLRLGATYVTQWLEAIERDYSHPSIIGWCPLNETSDPILDRITDLDDGTRGMFLAAKALDGTRPVLDTSGYSHRVAESDIYDSHDYDQDAVTMKERHEGRFYENYNEQRPMSIGYRGQPYFVSEFGGIWWNPEAKEGEDSWGYGDRPKTIEEFYDRFERLCGVLLDNPGHFGYCYTQLTDVYQEQNGIFAFDRRAKFDNARLRAAQQRKAAIED